MIICITGWFDKYRHGYPTGEKEFVVSHGIDSKTGDAVILQCVHPAELGAKLDPIIGEYVIDD